MPIFSSILGWASMQSGLLQQGMYKHALTKRTRLFSLPYILACYSVYSVKIQRMGLCLTQSRSLIEALSHIRLQVKVKVSTATLLCLPNSYPSLFLLMSRHLFAPFNPFYFLVIYFPSLDKQIIQNAFLKRISNRFRQHGCRPTA